MSVAQVPFVPQSIPTEEPSPTVSLQALSGESVLGESGAGKGARPELARLGAILRKAREERGLALEALADQLHMGRDQLQALESADGTRLPEKVFVVAQARRVASALGLDADPLIEDLRKVDCADPRERGGAALPQPHPSRSSPSLDSPPSRASRAPFPGRALAGVGALALLLAGAGLAWRHLGSLRPSGPTPVAQSQPAPQAAPAPQSPPVLLISSPQGSWISVRFGSGERLFQGNLKGVRPFPLTREIQVLAGRPDLVTVRVGTAEPRRFGRIDEVVWRSFRSP